MNSPVLSPGASNPNKSTKSVCSDKLILVKEFPVYSANAAIKLVLPTPGLPSKRIGFLTFKALTTLMRFIAVVGALILKELSDITLEVLSRVNSPHFNSLSFNSTCTFLSKNGIKSYSHKAERTWTHSCFCSRSLDSLAARCAVLFVPKASIKTMAAPWYKHAFLSLTSVRVELIKSTQARISLRDITPVFVLPFPNFLENHSENLTRVFAKSLTSSLSLVETMISTSLKSSIDGTQISVNLFFKAGESSFLP